RAVDPAFRARGSQIGLRSGRFARYHHAARMAVAAHLRARFGEQRPYRGFRLAVVALPEGGVANIAVRVEQVVGRPVFVVVGVPRPLVVVLYDRVANAELFDRVLDIAGFLLEGELGRLHADDRQSVLAVGRVPRLQVGQRAYAVDAGVGPEVDQHDPPAQPGERQRPAARRVEPVLGVREFRRRAEVGQFHRVRQQRRLARVGNGDLQFAG